MVVEGVLYKVVVEVNEAEARSVQLAVEVASVQVVVRVAMSKCTLVVMSKCTLMVAVGVSLVVEVGVSYNSRG